MVTKTASYIVISFACDRHVNWSDHLANMVRNDFGRRFFANSHYLDNAKGVRMSIEQRRIECEQYIDDEEPVTITLVPSGVQKEGKEFYLMVMETPFDHDVQLITHDEFMEKLHKWKETK